MGQQAFLYLCLLRVAILYLYETDIDIGKAC